MLQYGYISIVTFQSINIEPINNTHIQLHKKTCKKTPIDIKYVDVVRSLQNLNMLKTDTISIKFD